MGPSDIRREGIPSRGMGRVLKSLIPPMISIFSSCVILLRIESTRFSTSTLDGRTACAMFKGMKDRKRIADSNFRLGMAVGLMFERIGEKVAAFTGHAGGP